MNLKADFQKFIELLEAGEFLEIIDNYYDDEIVQLENAGPAVKGRSALRAIEERNMEGVNYALARIKEYIINEEKGIVMGEMVIRFDSKKTGKKRLEEAFIQKWKEGKIVYQRFYYDGFLDDN